MYLALNGEKYNMGQDSDLTGAMVAMVIASALFAFSLKGSRFDPHRH